MKAYLMYRDDDFDPGRPPPWNEADLTQDLALDRLFDAMAAGDKLVRDVARIAVLSSLVDPEAILYRQAVLRDCLANPSIIREMYALSTECLEQERKNYWGMISRHPSFLLHRSVEVLDMFTTHLRRLRTIAEQHGGKFRSEGFTALFAALKAELDDDYFAVVRSHLKQLKFREGVLISSSLGRGGKGTDFVLRQPSGPRPGWLVRLLTRQPESYTYHLHPRDEAGGKALSDLRDRGINLVANAVTQSTEHIHSFFSLLQSELAFYVGCLNLREWLDRKGEPACFPIPLPAGERDHSFAGLYDVCLSLGMDGRVVGNDGHSAGKTLIVVTGANQGGKSTFLRSIGLAQLMMQCGMFVPAQSFRANVCRGLVTHYKREEDATMESGKFDEELARMSRIAGEVRRDSLVLFNESFAATNDREGSEIATQIVRALLESGIKVFFVTHLHEFAHGLYGRMRDKGYFLRAERQADGRRTFKLIEGEPLQTSYGEDLYRRIFADRPAA